MWKDFIRLFFPNYCVGCQNPLVLGEAWLCTACLVDLPLTNYHLTPTQNILTEKFYGRAPLCYCMALYLFRTGGKVQHIVHTLKYHNQPKLGWYLGYLYGSVLAKIDWAHSFDGIVPIPLHPLRLHQRGYNQSKCFAEGLGRALNVPCIDEGIARIKNTFSQTNSNRLDRLEKLSNAFLVTDPTVFLDKHILLVDDVVTTGATVESCALALSSKGVKAISLATLAVVE